METVNAKEESITDFLVWKLRKIFNFPTYFINFEVFISPFSRQEENINGADLEISFIDRKNNLYLPFLIQAKKVKERYKGYCSELERYSRQRSNITQIELLIDYARKTKKLPFYLFYSNADRNIEVACGYLCEYVLPPFYWNLICNCLILQSAFKVRQVYNNKCISNSRRLSKYELTEGGNPFLCLFCCPVAQGYNPSPLEHLVEYLEIYYKDLIKEYGAKEILREIPLYIRDIIDFKLQKQLEKFKEEYMETEKDFLNKQILKILQKYKLAYRTEEGEYWIVKKLLIADLTAEE